MYYDLIIVGSGSVGSAAGYYASQHGLKVLMIDSGTPPHKNGSHHGGTRNIRSAYGEGAKYVPLVLHSKKLWKELSQKSGEELLKTCGLLNLGPANSKFIKNTYNSAQEYNIPVEKLTGDEVNARWSGINSPKEYVGVYEPDSGFLRSELAVDVCIKLSKKNGAEQLFNCLVKSVTPIANGVEVLTDNGKFQGRKVVVAAGTWVKNLLPTMPIVTIRKVLMWHQVERPINGMPCLFIEMNGGLFYSSLDNPKTLKVGRHSGGQKIGSVKEYAPFGACEEDDTELDGFLHQFLPGVGKRLHGEVCSYDMSPDDDFIIDTMPGCDNLMVITGLSGHGFKFSSALGEIAALFAQNKKPSLDISAFSLKRFGSSLEQGSASSFRWGPDIAGKF